MVDQTHGKLIWWISILLCTILKSRDIIDNIFGEVIRIGVLDVGAIPTSSTKSTPCWPLADDHIKTVSGTI
jgi:hypothetical protein